MNRRTILLLSILLIPLFLYITKSDKGPGLDIRQKGDSYIEGLRIDNRKAGVKDWSLHARRADISENGEKAFLSDIDITVMSRNASIHAEKGVYDMKSKDLTVDGEITAVCADYTIVSENVMYESSTGNLRSDGKVKMTGRKFTVTGVGMNTDNSGRKVWVHNNVVAVFN